VAKKKGGRILVELLELAIVPVVLMAYGWYLGQLHQSGPDIAGILLFITGLVGAVFAYGLYWLTGRLRWHGRWFVNILTGAASCVLVFALIILYARVIQPLMQ
jgi:hypothetical protein